jgi:hypothetical protein
MERSRRTTRWTNVVLACGAFVLCLAALDRLVAWTDLGYRAARYRPNEDRRLTRAEFDVHVVTNALGFRDARMPGPKPAGVRRVVVLGDSFTQGYGVEEPASYPRRLEAGLAREGVSDVQVVNLGVPGTSPRDYISHLADPGLAYAPDLVLIGVMGNDVQDVWIQRRFGVRFRGGGAARRAARHRQPSAALGGARPRCCSRTSIHSYGRKWWIFVIPWRRESQLRAPGRRRRAILRSIPHAGGTSCSRWASASARARDGGGVGRRAAGAA